MASLHLERLAALVVVAGKDQADASHQSGRQRTPVGGGGRVIVG